MVTVVMVIRRSSSTCVVLVVVLYRCVDAVVIGAVAMGYFDR